MGHFTDLYFVSKRTMMVCLVGIRTSLAVFTEDVSELLPKLGLVR